MLTGVGDTTTPNGIIGTTVIDVDGNGTADAVYGGDLRGNLWKFDISDTTSTNWAVAFSGNPLFNATVSGNAQPITSAPEVSLHPSGGVIVIFGTGRYVATGDGATTNTQSLYGVRDDGTNGSGTRSNLVEQTITTTTISSVNYRNVSVNTVDWANRRGWYIDLPLTGERMVVNPVLRNGRAIFTTLVPNSDPCSAGGYGWLMEIDYLTGGQLTERTLDTNGDNVVTAADALVAGKQLEGIASSPAIQGGYGSEQAPLENKYMNQSTGNVARVLESSAQWANRRMSWRQER
jgi:type IV pilus assembly protein PilY1